MAPIKKSCEHLQVNITVLFEHFRSLAKIDEIKKKIEMQAPDSFTEKSDSISEDLIRKIAERRDQELEKIERMIRYKTFSYSLLIIIFSSKTLKAVQKSLQDSTSRNSWPFCCGLNGEAGFFQPRVQIYDTAGELDSDLTRKCSNPSLELGENESPLFSHSETKVFGLILFLFQ